MTGTADLRGYEAVAPLLGVRQRISHCYRWRARLHHQIFSSVVTTDYGGRRPPMRIGLWRDGVAFRPSPAGWRAAEGSMRSCRADNNPPRLVPYDAFDDTAYLIGTREGARRMGQLRA